MNDNCWFCGIKETDPENVIMENQLVRAIWDGEPVSQGHALIVPLRHVQSYFDISDAEVLAIYHMLRETKKIIDDQFHPDSYNIGINNGVEAGQTVYHCHTHLIPRYAGDVSDPRGGVWRTIPGKEHE